MPPNQSPNKPFKDLLKLILREIAGHNIVLWHKGNDFKCVISFDERTEKVQTTLGKLEVSFRMEDIAQFKMADGYFPELHIQD